MDAAAELSARFIKRSSDEWEAWQRKKRMSKPIEAADERDVMREQLELVMAHADELGPDHAFCSTCQRLLFAKMALLEPVFGKREGPMRVGFGER